MPHPSNFRDAAELLKIILEGTLPADAQMDRYFRARREMGVRDRGFVAETVYGCLREKRMLEYLTTPGMAKVEQRLEHDYREVGGRVTPGAVTELPSTTDKPSLMTGRASKASGTPSSFDLIAAYLVTHGYSGRSLEELGYRGDARQLAERVRGLDQTAVPFAVRANLPDWLAGRLPARLGEAQALLHLGAFGLERVDAQIQRCRLVERLHQRERFGLTKLRQQPFRQPIRQVRAHGEWNRRLIETAHPFRQLARIAAVTQLFQRPSAVAVRDKVGRNQVERRGSPGPLSPSARPSRRAIR